MNAHSNEPEAAAAPAGPLQPPELAEQYRGVVEDLTEVIGRFKADGTLTFVNEVYCRFFGKTRRELIGSRWQPRAVAEDVPLIEEKLRTLSPANPVVVIENRVHAGNGDVRWMQFVNRAFFDAAGRHLETQSVGRDITGRKQAEAKLRESEAVRRQALESTPNAVFAVDRQYRLLFNNQRHARAVVASGGNPFQVGENLLSPDYPAETRELWRAAYDRALRGEEFRLESDWLDLDGQRRFSENSFSPLRDASGAITGVLVVVQDITARRHSEEALRASEQRFRTLFRSSPASTTITRLHDGVFLDANDAFLAQIGRTRAEVVGRTAAELGLWPVPEQREALIRQLQDQGSVYGFEAQFGKQSGEVGTVLLSATLITLDGQPHLLAAGIDRTAQKQVEDALRESEHRRIEAQRIARIGNWEWNLRTGEVVWSTEIYTMSGMIPDAQVRSPDMLLKIVHPDDVEKVRAAISQAVAEGKAADLDYRIVWPDGSIHVIHALGAVTEVDAEGRPALMVGTNQDITDRRRLEAERTAALARLTAVEELERQRLSRELHDQTAQRLVALAVELKSLETSLAAGQPPAGRIRSLRTAVDELQLQVRQLAWNLRAGELAEGGVASALSAYAEDWSERAGVPVDCECRGMGDRRLSAPVEAALYRVAQEALANVERHARAHRVSLLLERDEAVVRLTVEDDGCGFDVEAVQQAPGAAPRLGLLGIRERVLLAGGTLLIESAPGSGTTVLVRIPVTAEAENP